jgi:hypothetical protein
MRVIQYTTSAQLSRSSQRLLDRPVKAGRRQLRLGQVPGLDSPVPHKPPRQKEIRSRLSAARFNGTTPRERDCAMFDALRVNALLVTILAAASAVNGIMFYQYL